MSPALQGRFLTTGPPGTSPQSVYLNVQEIAYSPPFKLILLTHTEPPFFPPSGNLENLASASFGAKLKTRVHVCVYVCACVCVCMCVCVYGGSYTQSSVKLLVKCGQIVNQVGIKEGVPPRSRMTGSSKLIQGVSLRRHGCCPAANMWPWSFSLGMCQGHPSDSSIRSILLSLTNQSTLQSVRVLTSVVSGCGVDSVGFNSV